MRNRRRIAFYVVATLFTLLLAAFGLLLFPLFLTGLQAWVAPAAVGAHIVHNVIENILFGLPLPYPFRPPWRLFASTTASTSKLFLNAGDVDGSRNGSGSISPCSSHCQACSSRKWASCEAGMPRRGAE